MMYGTYETMTQEKQIMLKTTQTEKMIIHFSHKDFKKCAVMDKHLQVCLWLLGHSLVTPTLFHHLDFGS